MANAKFYNFDEEIHGLDAFLFLVDEIPVVCADEIVFFAGFRKILLLSKELLKILTGWVLNNVRAEDIF